METNAPQIPGAGPPKKGFWGFIAGLFPKRPAPLEPPTSTGEVLPDIKSGQDGKADGGDVKVSEETAGSSDEDPSAPAFGEPDSPEEDRSDRGDV